MQGISLVDLATVGAAGTPALRHLQRIVRAATARPPGRPTPTAVRCRRRPDRSACVGYIETQCQDLPDLVRWRCAACGDVGVARHWRQSPWRIANTPLAGPPAHVVVPEAAYRTIQRCAPDDALAQRVVHGAQSTDAGLRLDGGVDTLRRLHRCLAAVGRHDDRSARQARIAARALAAGLNRWTTKQGESRPG